MAHRSAIVLAAVAMVEVYSVGATAGAHEAQITTRLLVEINDISGVAISPDEKTVVFRVEQASIEKNTYDSTWYAEPIDGSAAPIRIADGGVPLRRGGLAIDEAPRWSADSRWIYFRALIDGEIEVWRAARDGSKDERVTEDDADVESFWLFPAREGLIYRTGATREAIERAEQRDDDQGVRIDQSVYSGQGLFRSALVNGRLVSQRTDKSMARRMLLWNTPKRYRIVNLARLSTHNAADADIRAIEKRERQEGHAVLSPNGRREAMLSGAPPSTALSVQDANQPSLLFKCGPCRALKIDAMAWAGEGKLLLTARNTARGYAQSLYLWDIAEQTLRRIAASDGLLSGDRTGRSPCAAGIKAAVCVVASPDAPPRLERFDLDTGERATLYQPNSFGRLNVNVEFRDWKDNKGRRFTGYLFTRKGVAKRSPLFVTYYLCRGFLRGGEGDEWPLIPLAQAGIAALCINGQLPPRQGRDAVKDYDAALAGVRAIIRILAKRGLIDPKEVGMGGHSFGSETTLWIASHSRLLAAASVSSPDATPVWYWFHALQSGFREIAKDQWGLGRPDETPDRWRILSPEFYAEKFDAPIIMQMPEREFRSALPYFVKMHDRGLPAELWAFPNEPHIKFQPRHKLAIYDRNLDWFRFWLQGFVDPAPAKAKQYRRWTAMRDRWIERSARRSDPR